MKRVYSITITAFVSLLLSIYYVGTMNRDGLTELYIIFFAYICLLILYISFHFIPQLRPYKYLAEVEIFLCPIIFYLACELAPNYNQYPYAKVYDLQNCNGAEYSIYYNSHYKKFEIWKDYLDDIPRCGRTMTIVGDIVINDNQVIFSPNDSSFDEMKRFGEMQLIQSFIHQKVYIEGDSINELTGPGKYKLKEQKNF